MNNSFFDLNEIEHENCPNCNNNWIFLNKDRNYVHCSKNCGFSAMKRIIYPTRSLFILSLSKRFNYDLYNILWYKNYTECHITKWQNNTYNTEKIKIHTLLPFNITLEKLKIYLLFI